MSPTGDLSRELDVAGKDPLRYLNRSLLDDENARERARARIRGLRDLKEVNAWISVERKLQRGPRSTVLDWLEKRRDEVLDLGIYDLDEYLQETDLAETESYGSVCRILRETDDGYEAVDPSTRGPRVTTERPSLEAFKARRDEREKQSSPDAREEPSTPDVDTVGLEDQVAIADGGDANEQGLTSDQLAECPDCNADLVEHHINGELGLWCPDCRTFPLQGGSE
ncbi:hypothetical protein [Halorarius halobius]|uniref:hypothetical protein n=1 Tax=Halorarius halobius TaxID=2962671 RepID=UPI0020CC1E6F|nr:hypothetical protein [Halorarius halobius]